MHAPYAGRAHEVSEKFDLVYHEAYCFITWMPEGLPTFVKAMVSTHQVRKKAVKRRQSEIFTKEGVEAARARAKVAVGRHCRI